MTEEPTIEAAGGVVLRRTQRPAGRRTDDPPAPGDRIEVLVVHRPAYDDWSLPKGKLDPGEDARAAAVREVAEETGVDARPGPELPSITYRVDGIRKRVRWYRMEPIAGDPATRPPDDEVDVARWIPAPDALPLLTYGPDRRLLATALRDLPT